MSEIEPAREQPPETLQSSAGSDPWQIWFTRAVQAAGLGIMIFEAVGRRAERPWLMLFATGMMLGGIGLQGVLQWAMGRQR